MEDRTVDLTPSPRLLRMLGRIEFDNWQCLAELIDNSIDAISESGVGGEIEIMSPSMNEYDKKDDGARLIVEDDGPGMSTGELERNLRAGYSGNDPVNKLGLFGMGFNIATARLGGRTKVKTTRRGDEDWKTVVIDFDEMERGDSYDRKIRTEEKANTDIHGTKIIVSKLKERVRTLRQQRSVKDRLNRIYTPILKNNDIEIWLNNDRLEGREHCVWDGSRCVERSGEEIPARIDINETIGEEYYCKNCWTWWEEETFPGSENECPDCEENGNIVLREQKIEGWLGVQCFYDKDHYGIDFIRNGRVIEELDKSLFYWKDGEEEEKEYPIDATHWGGRIVGEIHIDFVPVAYTKDSFEKYDERWQNVRSKLRGEAPMRPQIAQREGYPRNESPLAKLFNGYRYGRPPGKKNLVPGRVTPDGDVKGMNDKPKEWAEKFWEGHPDYQDDSKWWEAVVQAEKAKRSSGEGGDIETITPGEGKETGEDGEKSEEEGDKTGATGDGKKQVGDEQEPKGIMISDAEEMADISGDYNLDEFDQPSIDILVMRLVDGDLQGQPIVRDVKSTRDIEFTVDPDHTIYTGYEHGYMDLVLMELAGLLHKRLEDPDEWTPSQIFTHLKDKHCADERLDPEALSTRATELLERIQTAVGKQEVKYSSHPEDVVEDVREQVFHRLGEGEETVQEVLQTSEYVEYAPPEELVTFLRKNPHEFFDGAVSDRPYESLGSPELQDQVLSEFESYIEDVIWLSREGETYDLSNIRDELRMRMRRCSYSLDILQNEVRV